jgi:hypothetical protein
MIFDFDLGGNMTYVVSWRIPESLEKEPDLPKDCFVFELEEIIDICTSEGVRATLFDEQGFTKGFVSDDGNYQLK